MFLRTPYTEGNQPHIDRSKPLRGNKKPGIISLKKQEPKERFYHCSVHIFSRMIRFSDGLRCPICGSPDFAIRIVDTLNE